jgi:hypothetical protein
MPKRRDVVAAELHQLADDLEELWKALTRDPGVEQRKQRGWTLFAGFLVAAATMASRRAVAKMWPILTGERPPVGPAPGARESPRPSSHRDEVVRSEKAGTETTSV